MTIIVDTREQRPLFKFAKRQKLDVGDYTTSKLLGKFHIERKSLQDLYQTITRGNMRFKKELFRAAWHQVTICIYVEGTREDFTDKNFPRGEVTKVKTETLDRIIRTFEKEYHLCFFWHRDRKKCIDEVVKRLEVEEKWITFCGGCGTVFLENATRHLKTSKK